ncbi:DUF218 domain-containing protein [Loktanella atrilutea]|uniref:DUF218 domain-containing protein n=2 Tax=Loktanella atrilutea TaxID=366533 RepID=A0A1M4XG55_LOKAT|nr:DUF218 domain-containing protein [Loktanella atrilutea]
MDAVSPPVVCRYSGHMKAIVILGAAVWAEGPSPTLRRRARHGARLWHAGEGQIIVACGGMGRHPPTEAEAIAQILMEEGIPTDAILQEDRSTTTLENIRFALPLLRRHHVDQIVIVTDATHGPRALRVARHFRLKARCSAPSLRGSHKRSVLRQALRELGAYPLYAIRLMGQSRDD